MMEPFDHNFDGNPGYDKEIRNPGGHMNSTQGQDRSVHSPALARAAFILGVIAAISLVFIYIAVPLGALAILLALLSRGNHPLFGRARTAVTLGICAIIASSVITGYSFFRIWTDPVLKARFQQMLDYYMTYYIGDEETRSEANDNADTLPRDGAAEEAPDAAGPSHEDIIYRRSDSGTSSPDNGTPYDLLPQNPAHSQPAYGGDYT